MARGDWMQMLDGIIVYSRVGYLDGGDFVDQVDDIVKKDENIVFALDDEISFRIASGRLCAYLPNGEELNTVNRPSWAMMRTNNWQVAYGLECLGTKCFPSSNYIRTSSDKVLSHIRMSDYFDTLDTVLTQGTTNLRKYEYPCIMKASTGFGGYDVEKVHDPDSAQCFANKLREEGKEPIYQKLAPTPSDLRVYIMGDQIMLALLRKAASGSSRANLSQGGIAEVYELSDAQVARIEAALASFEDDLGFVSFDFLFDESGNMVFNEMNCFPGITFLGKLGLSEGFVEEYVKYLRETLGNRENTCEKE